MWPLIDPRSRSGWVTILASLPHPPGCLSPGAATSLEAWVSLRGPVVASPARWEEAGPSLVALGGRSLIAARAWRSATRRCRSPLATRRALSPRETGAVAARRRPRGEVPECPPSPALSSPLPFFPSPAVRSHRSPAIPLPGPGANPECARRRVGTLADLTLGNHPGLPASHQPRFSGLRP